jgi:hypothetical protein
MSTCEKCKEPFETVEYPEDMCPRCSMGYDNDYCNCREETFTVDHCGCDRCIVCKTYIRDINDEKTNNTCFSCEMSARAKSKEAEQKVETKKNSH